MFSNGDRVARLNPSKMPAQRIPERAYPNLHVSPLAPVTLSATFALSIVATGATDQRAPPSASRTESSGPPAQVRLAATT